MTGPVVRRRAMSRRNLLLGGFAFGLSASAIAGCLPAPLPPTSRTAGGESRQPEADPDGDSSGEARRDRETGRSLKVALVMPGPANDGGWSQSAYEGLAAIAQELGAETAYTAETHDWSPEAQAQLFRDYASGGYEFVIGHGSEFQTPLETVAAEFPRVKFAIVADYPGNNRNFGSLGFRYGELGYLAGAVAALKTRTGRVALVGGKPSLPMQQEVIGLERGAAAIDPAIAVEAVYIGSWSAPDKARQATQVLLDGGADVIAAISDAGNPAVFEAVAAAGAWAIGWQKDQHDFAPEAILTSCIQDAAPLMLEGARRVRRGLWQGKKYLVGLAEGAQKLAPFRGSLPPEAIARVEALQQDILRGRVDVLS